MWKRELLEIMEGEKKHPFLSPATILWSLSLLFGAMVRFRRMAYEKAIRPSYCLPCPVISVGNLAVGGTGKTPMVVHLAQMIGRLGLKAAVVSRGYRGGAQKQGMVVTDGRSITGDTRLAGDEPYLMATLLENVPVVVGKDRWAAGKKAFDLFKPDIIVLDDAFQHLRLKRDLNLLLLDARRPFGNGYLLPRGILREPASILNRADAIVLTRWERGLGVVGGIDYPKPIFRSIHQGIVRGVAPARHPLPPLRAVLTPNQKVRDKKVFGFAGLADSESFFNGLKRFGFVVQGAMAFEDHHDYSDGDIRKIAQGAVASGAECLITTDKDYVRFANSVRFPVDLVVMGVDIEFQGDIDPWTQFFNQRLNELLN